MNYKPMLITLLVGFFGALLFLFLHIPMPWLLGAIAAVLCVQLFTTIQLRWHTFFRNFGLVVAGYSIGYAFTPEALQDIQRFLGSMIVLNFLFILLFIGVSVLVARQTGLDLTTAIVCCVPGGMSQILVYAEEQGGMDIATITFFQVLRVLLIVSFVPLLAAGTSVGDIIEYGHFSFGLAGFLAVCGVAGWIAQKIRIPTGYMLGPILLLMGLNLAGVEVPKMPISLLHIAQLVIGIYIGLLLKKEDLHLSKRHIFYAFISAGIYIGAAYGFAFVMEAIYGLDFRTGFLSIVPGGLDQMGIIAASVHASVTNVTAFQLFRILVVSILIVPMVKFFVHKRRA